ncbi:MAG: LytTR family transcriptional regulator [Lachnospiraceae bacterium]|nr:LytTR family transcriptional regulator [Lachnospiraceae bacterium]
MKQNEDKLIISSRGRIDLLNKNEIFYIHSEHRQVHIHMPCETYSFYRTLDEVEENISDSHFMRIHKSFLINTSFVCRIDGGTLYITTGEHLPVSRRYLTSVHRRFRAL